MYLRLSLPAFYVFTYVCVTGMVYILFASGLCALYVYLYAQYVIIIDELF